MFADGFLIGFMAGLALLSLYWLNGNTYFDPEDSRVAEKVCASNGGLKYVSADIADLDVVCVNGAVFELTKHKAKIK